MQQSYLAPRQAQERTRAVQEPEQATQPWGNAAMAESMLATPDEGLADWMNTGEASSGDQSWTEDETTAQGTEQGPVLTEGPAPTGLGAVLVAELGQAPTFASLDASVAAAPVDERQAAYRSATVQQAIAASALTGAEKLALSTALAEGSLTWKHTQGGSEFCLFFGSRNGEGPPPAMEGMSCFELILYSAWMIGQLSVAQVSALYKPSENNPLKHVAYGDLGFSNVLPTWSLEGPTKPSVGDLIFAVSDGLTDPRHVMMSLGGDTAMSLDKEQVPQPTTRVNLANEAPGHTLYFGPAKWL